MTKLFHPFARLALILTFYFSVPAAIADGIDPFLRLKSEVAVNILLQDSGLVPSRQAATAYPLENQAVTSESGYDFVELTLGSAKLGPIRLFMRGPRGFLQDTSHKFRALFLASGFLTDKSAVRLLADEPQTVVIGFVYPASLADLKRDPARAPAMLFDFIRKTPLEIAAALAWLSERPWLKRQSLTAIGVSLGGLFLPASLHIAQSLGTPVAGTVLAFTGAHLPPVLELQLKPLLPPDVLEQVLRLAANLTALVDPKLHLPLLSGNFLALRSDRDQVFPRESSQILEDLLPQPKQIVVFQGGHVDVDQPALIAKSQSAIHDWLASFGW